MPTYVVTGTSRGLGLGLVKVLASMPVEDVSIVFATTRSGPSPELSEVISEHQGRVQHVKLEVDSTESIKAAAAEIGAKLGPAGLDYLINNTAVRDPDMVEKIEDMGFLRDALATNVVGTHETICEFLPLLRQGKKKVIVNFSSTLGCITGAQTDPSRAPVPFPAYKISKAGTHMLTALWSNRLKPEGFCVTLQSPGNLRTKLAGGERADLPIEVGAKEVIRITQSSGPEDSGRHRNIHVKGWENGGGVGGVYDGKDLYW